jgi:hypothetical protein
MIEQYPNEPLIHLDVGEEGSDTHKRCKEIISKPNENYEFICRYLERNLNGELTLLVDMINGPIDLTDTNSNQISLIPKPVMNMFMIEAQNRRNVINKKMKKIEEEEEEEKRKRMEKEEEEEKLIKEQEELKNEESRKKIQDSLRSTSTKFLYQSYPGNNTQNTNNPIMYSTSYPGSSPPPIQPGYLPQQNLNFYSNTSLQSGSSPPPTAYLPQQNSSFYSSTCGSTVPPVSVAVSQQNPIMYNNSQYGNALIPGGSISQQNPIMYNNSQYGNALVPGGSFSKQNPIMYNNSQYGNALVPPGSFVVSQQNPGFYPQFGNNQF